MIPFIQAKSLSSSFGRSALRQPVFTALLLIPPLLGLMIRPMPGLLCTDSARAVVEGIDELPPVGEEAFLIGNWGVDLAGNPGLHLLSRLICEGHSKDLPWRDAALDHMNNACRQNTRLA